MRTKMISVLMAALSLLAVGAWVFAQTKPTASTQDFDPYDCYGLKAEERTYQLLLKRWYEGADGHGQGGPVDSVVLNRVKNRLNDDLLVNYVNAIKKSPRMLKVYDDLQRYRGLGIFQKGNYVTPTSAKVLKEYYNMDIKDEFDTWNTGVEYFYGSPNYMLVCVVLPDEELMFYLVSWITLEVLSTYKRKVNKVSPLKEKECEGKEFIFKEFIGPDSIKMTEF